MFIIFKIIYKNVHSEIIKIHFGFNTEKQSGTYWSMSSSLSVSKSFQLNVTYLRSLFGPGTKFGRISFKRFFPFSF